MGEDTGVGLQSDGYRRSVRIELDNGNVPSSVTNRRFV